MPRQLQPDAIRREYYNALLPFVHIATQEIARIRADIMYGLMTARRVIGKFDGKHETLILIERAKKAALNALRPGDVEIVATKFGRRTSDWSKEQLSKQVTAAMSVPLSAIETPIRDKIEVFAKENVELIKTVHERYFDRIQSDVEQAYAEGIHPNDLAELLMERDDMAENDAMRIARDQIGKLNARFNEERQKDMGVTGYIWRTSNDSRVRDEHQEREGQRYEWDDPPEDGHPGEAIQCRCYAEPVLDDIIESLTEQS